MKINKETKVIDTIESSNLQVRLEKDLSTGFWIYIRRKPAYNAKPKEIKDFDWLMPLSNPFQIYQLKHTEDVYETANN